MHGCISLTIEQIICNYITAIFYPLYPFRLFLPFNLVYIINRLHYIAFKPLSKDR